MTNCGRSGATSPCGRAACPGCSCPSAASRQLPRGPSSAPAPRASTRTYFATPAATTLPTRAITCAASRTSGPPRSQAHRPLRRERQAGASGGCGGDARWLKRTPSRSLSRRGWPGGRRRGCQRDGKRRGCAVGRGVHRLVSCSWHGAKAAVPFANGASRDQLISRKARARSTDRNLLPLSRWFGRLEFRCPSRVVLGYR